MTVDWEAVDKRIPTAPTPDGQAARAKLFEGMDPNGNGLLSLTEVNGGLPALVSGLVKVKDFRPAIKCAFALARNAAPDAAGGGGKKSKAKKENESMVDHSEFHALLIAFRQFIEMDVMFDSIDKDGTRMLNWKELEKALPKLEDWNLGKKADVKKRFFKDDWTDSLKYEDFAEWAIEKKLGGLKLQLDENDAFESLQEHMMKQDGYDQCGKLLKAFEKWDKDGNGKITEEELYDVLSQLDETFTKDNAAELFKAADLNQDGNIDYAEFAKWIVQ